MESDLLEEMKIGNGSFINLIGQHPTLIVICKVGFIASSIQDFIMVFNIDEFFIIFFY